jgi:ubiquinone/menaquinone biosynthesis C-methylase UbiE
MRRHKRPGVRDGYDLWARTYDSTSNPLVALDQRHTIPFLRPRPDERILDAACGTGRHLAELVRARSRPVGLDISHGMLRAARRKLPAVPLVQADLEQGLPVSRGACDAILLALVGEHLRELAAVFADAYRALKSRGRMVFSVFHPQMAASGIEANFEQAGVEYRLGALRHSISDYANAIADSGFRSVEHREFDGDDELVKEVPWASKYVGRPLLLVLTALKD